MKEYDKIYVISEAPKLKSIFKCSKELRREYRKTKRKNTGKRKYGFK